MEENKEEKIGMRKLKTMDIFALSRILKKMNIKDELKGLYKDVSGLSDKKKKEAEENLYLELALLFIENLGGVEKEIDELLGSLTAKSAEDISNLDADKLLNLLKELFSQGDFASFLSLASRQKK